MKTFLLICFSLGLMLSSHALRAQSAPVVLASAQGPVVTPTGPAATAQRPLKAAAARKALRQARRSEREGRRAAVGSLVTGILANVFLLGGFIPVAGVAIAFLALSLILTIVSLVLGVKGLIGALNSSGDDVTIIAASLGLVAGVTALIMWGIFALTVLLLFA